MKEILSNADVVLSTLTGSSRDGTLKYDDSMHCMCIHNILVSVAAL